MNQPHQPQKPKRTPLTWEAIVKAGKGIQHGELTVKIQDNRIVGVELKQKGQDEESLNNFVAFTL